MLAALRRLMRPNTVTRKTVPRERRRIRRLETLEPRCLLTYVELETTFGTIHMILDDHSAPHTARNFLSHIDRDDFDNTIFHRLVPGATLSGGRHYVDGSLVYQGDSIRNEFSRSNLRGTLAAVQEAGTDRAGSAWFINLNDNPQLDELRYTVFGHVITSDMEIVDAIAALPTFDIRGHEGVPLRDFALTDPPQAPGPENFVVIEHARRTPITMSIFDERVEEGDDGVRYVYATVALSVSSDFSTQVNYATVDGSARAGEDYSSTNRTLFLAAGQTSQTVRVTIHPDRQAEPDETFRIVLSNVSGAQLIDGEATVTIINDDGGLPGDTNLDFRVDLMDLNNVRNNFGATGSEVIGDTNGDAVVDLADLNDVRNNFGAATATSANQLVPALHRRADAVDRIFDSRAAIAKRSHRIEEALAWGEALAAFVDVPRTEIVPFAARTRNAGLPCNCAGRKRELGLI